MTLRSCRLVVVLAALAVATFAPAAHGVAQAPRPGVPGRLLVHASPGASPAAVAAAVALAGGTPLLAIGQIGVVAVAVVPGTEAAVTARLLADRAIARVERDALVSAADVAPNDLLWPGQTGPREISAPAAWDLSRGAPGTVIAVLDSGVDTTHPELAPKLTPGYDFVNGDADPEDDNGHGTAVAGIAAAVTDNSTGMAGICWLCSIMPVKVIGADGTGTTSTLAAGLTWAADHGARVINMSVSGPVGTDALAAAVRYATQKGAVVVAAAGNDGSTSPSYPAAYDGVVSVAATTALGLLYPFSNRGSWVDVAAPGCTTAPSRLLDAYTFFCGTSGAAPLVAGVAGLAASLVPTATPPAIVTALEQGATPLAGADVAHGQVDAFRTLSLLAPAAPPPPPAASPPATSPPATSPPATSPPATTRGTTARPAVARAPAARRRPTVRAVGRKTLLGSQGAWAGARPLRLAYQWLRCRHGRCRPIAGASRRRYRIGSRDRHATIVLRVTASNRAGSASSVSRPARRGR